MLGSTFKWLGAAELFSTLPKFSQYFAGNSSIAGQYRKQVGEDVVGGIGQNKDGKEGGSGEAVVKDGEDEVVLLSHEKREVPEGLGRGALAVGVKRGKTLEAIERGDREVNEN